MKPNLPKKNTKTYQTKQNKLNKNYKIGKFNFSLSLAQLSPSLLKTICHIGCRDCNKLTCNSKLVVFITACIGTLIVDFRQDLADIK